jgi:uncharacterized protein
MKRFRIALLFVGLGLLADDAGAQTTPFAGSWAGELDVQGTRLPLVFHIAAGESGLGATMDSPLQGALGIPVDSVLVHGDTVTLRLVAIGGTYVGRLAGDSIIGDWRQGGLTFPLLLRRSDPQAAALRRPQNPQPPLPYRVEEVTFRNEMAGITLAGTLTLPPAGGPFPAVALISGSGPQDRDETLLGHKPFLVLADHLTRAGIAVLRYDDRGVGQSGGDFSAATSLDFAGDAAAAATYLMRRPEVHASRVGLIGHSEGGLIAPLVATGAHGAAQSDVAFLVLLAGPALRGDSILRLQMAAITAAAGRTPDQQRDALALQARMIEVLRTEPDATTRRTRLRAELGAAIAALSAEERVAQGIPPGQEAAWIDAQSQQLATDWFRTFVSLDPEPVLHQVRVPTLALFGALDLQVPPRENDPAMRAALDVAPTRDFTVTTLPGLNHLFQTAATGTPAEYGSIEETVAPAALSAVSSWILARFGSRPAK